jgi:serine/threonine-protein kinase
MHPSGNAALSPRLRVGDVVGPYTIVREIGRGAMATVYEASRAEGKPVALKVLLPEVAQHAELRDRFEREGRILQALRHENIARVYEVGVLPRGSLYLAIELLEGSDLGTMLQTLGRLSVDIAAAYVRDAARGVAEAHAQGIVHRDLKPTNIFLAKNRVGQDVVKVLDFGVAKVLGAVESEADARQLIGSPHYIAPDQLQGSAAVTPRTDVWALGVVLYKALTDAYPFEGASLPELCRRIREASPRPLRELRPDCPPRLQDVLHRCLAKDPTARFAHAGELADALEEFAAEEDEEVTKVQEESTRFMPDARSLQQRSAIASLTGMQATGESTGARPVLSLSSITSASSITPGRALGTGISAVSSGSFRAVAAGPPTPARPRALRWWIVGLGAAVLLVGVGAIGVVRTAGFARGTSSVEVRVTSRPEGAFFTIDYGAQQIAPAGVRLRRDDRAHILTVWKDGYRPEARGLSATSDVSVDVTLVPLR